MLVNITTIWAVTTSGRTPPQPSNMSNWLLSVTKNWEAIRAEQQADPDMSEACGWVQKGVRPHYGDISHGGPELKFLWGSMTAE